jgi:S-methylmethionine-dependent homocysteine/selenocysteine methylase
MPQMFRYRNALPQLSGNLFLTDGGLETTMIFHEGLELPYFAAFDLLKDQDGYEAIKRYFRTYAALAKDYEVGLILDGLTWRANQDWGTKLGYSAKELAGFNRKAVELYGEIRDEFENEATEIVISGCIGPRGDGYAPANMMSAKEAEQYHIAQIGTLNDTEADMVTALTINYVEEAIGITQAAKSANMPVVISFTVETDGKLPTGLTLKDAIKRVDEATDNFPLYYMVNCAHPTHFEDVLGFHETWSERIHGLRANASVKSHEELNDSEQLDDGNPVEFGRQHRKLAGRLKNLNVVGGCCGTDHRHVEEICKALIAQP